MSTSRILPRFSAKPWAALALVVAFSACSDDKGVNTSGERTGQAFIYLTDYQSGALAEYDSRDTSVTGVPFPSLHTDVALRSYDGLLYVIERFGKDAISVVDPKTPSSPLANYSVGNGTNPQDIVVVSDAKAYVFRLGAANVLVINPMTGDSIGTVDVSPFADAADGMPELAGATLRGEAIYAIAQVLDTKSYPYFWPPTGPGKLLAINTRTNTVELKTLLTIKNPVAIAERDGIIYIAGGPYDDLSTAGIDRYNTSNNSVRNVVRGTTLGGRPTAIEVLDDGGELGWVLVAKDWPKASVYKLNLATGVVADSLVGPTSPSAISLGEGNQLLVSDRSMTNPGVYVFDGVTGRKIKGPIATALPPDVAVFLRK